MHNEVIYRQALIYTTRWPTLTIGHKLEKRSKSCTLKFYLLKTILYSITKKITKQT
jgi:hypothetical protein